MVSIIVPIYRIDEAYLRQCIESIIGQTYHDIEIILVDDGSPDNSGAICDEYAKKDERIRVIHQENAGAAVARNNGVLAAKSEYVMFAAPDDWFELDCIEKVLPEAEKQQVDLLYFQYCMECGDCTKNFPKVDSHALDRKEREEILYCMVRDNGASSYGFQATPPWGKIIRKSVIKGIVFPTGLKRGQDYIFSLYLLEKADSAYYLDYVGYHYRYNDNAISHRYNPQIAEIIIQMRSLVREFVKAYHASEKRYSSTVGAGNMKAISTIENTYWFHKDCTLSKKEVITELKNFFNQDIVKDDMAYCKMRDFQSVKSKIKYLLLKWHLFGVYYEYRSRNNRSSARG